MKFVHALAAAMLAAGLGLSATACTSNGYATNDEEAVAEKVDVTIESASGAHVFHTEVAKSAAEQARGLMYRTDLPDDFGMLFWPYPAGGGAPREASFWMKNTPSPLDIIFIRPDGTIARVAANAVPFDESPIASGEPVGAVLEIRGGRAGELGIQEGDTVRWPGQKRG
ncbi:DUF192 domain-containing protein [Stakelama saccharophila]|uniref:DUF192 domain-containing protein n=1 Tax=Stakelama saccharophila TaxID=3075605 RepID=A0ABZ0B6X8_9SPHN|nr:DUF192 domain-containing protein [Stakelama sp. W311]WNO53128.1 DUF192 domain-containing protein [Stakelama sp. W311]